MEEKAQALRIGFIGAGENTRKMHLPGFRAIEGVELAVVANRTLASAQRVAAEFGIARVAEDWRAVVADPEVDAICIGTWPYRHAEISIAALAQGKHVLCEARMACDYAEARQMLAAAQAHPKLVAQLVPAPLSLDHDALIREMISGGQLGKILEVRVTHTGGQFADPQAPMTWRQDRALSGLNVLTLGILHETVQRWLEDDADWVQADGAVFQTPRAHWESGALQAVEIPDSLTVLGRTRHHAARLIYHFSGVEPLGPQMELRINGSRGSLRFDALAAELFFAASGQAPERIAPAPELVRGWQVEADFVQSIRYGAPALLTSFEQGVHYMKFTQMVADSLAQGGRRIAWRDLD